jgi:hypothetical protein
MITHSYEHAHTHPILMSTSEEIGRLDPKIYKVSHQERLVIDDDVTYH